MELISVIFVNCTSPLVPLLELRAGGELHVLSSVLDQVCGFRRPEAPTPSVSRLRSCSTSGLCLRTAGTGKPHLFSRGLSDLIKARRAFPAGKRLQ